jgi:hypothetical protein
MVNANYPNIINFSLNELQKFILNRTMIILHNVTIYNIHHREHIPLILFYYVSYWSLMKPKNLIAKHSWGNCVQNILPSRAITENVLYQPPSTLKLNASILHDLHVCFNHRWNTIWKHMNKNWLSANTDTINTGCVQQWERPWEKKGTPLLCLFARPVLWKVCMVPQK